MWAEPLARFGKRIRVERYLELICIELGLQLFIPELSVGRAGGARGMFKSLLLS